MYLDKLAKLIKEHFLCLFHPPAHTPAHSVVSLQNESKHCVCAFIIVQDVDTDGHEVGSCQKIISSAYAGK